MKKVWVFGVMVFLPLSLQAMDTEDDLQTSIENYPSFLQVEIPRSPRPKVIKLSPEFEKSTHFQQKKVSPPKKNPSSKESLLKRVLMNEHDKSQSNNNFGETIERPGSPDYMKEKN